MCIFEKTSLPHFFLLGYFYMETAFRFFLKNLSNKFIPKLFVFRGVGPIFLKMFYINTKLNY